jgi:hypothetical protein
MLLRALFSDFPLSESASIKEVSDACLDDDPTFRPTIAGMASDADWLGPLSDSVKAYLKALNGDTDKPTPIRREVEEDPWREDGEAPASPHEEPNQTEPRSPLFSGEAHKDYSRHKKKLEAIFTSHFPHWNESSYELCVLPLAEIPHTTIYYWKRKWDADQSW